YLHAYRQSMTATTKNLLAAAAPGASEQGFHPVQGQQRFAGPQTIESARTWLKPNLWAAWCHLRHQLWVVYQKGQPHNAPAAPGHPTPNTINSSIMQSPAPNGTPSVPPASNPLSVGNHNRFSSNSVLPPPSVSLPLPCLFMTLSPTLLSYHPTSPSMPIIPTNETGQFDPNFGQSMTAALEQRVSDVALFVTLL
ncbi:hypothetical protein EDD22DRAFT_910596, partial [Suillus occidentalis]